MDVCFVGTAASALTILTEAVQLDSPGETLERLSDELRATPNPLELGRFQKQTDGLEIPRTESLFNALRGPVDALPEGFREALAPLGYTADLPIPRPLAEALTGLAGGELISFLEECSSKSVLSADGDQITLHSLTTAVIAATNSKDRNEHPLYHLQVQDVWQGMGDGWMPISQRNNLDQGFR